MLAEEAAKTEGSTGEEQIKILVDYKNLKKDQRPHLSEHSYSEPEIAKLERDFASLLASMKTTRGKVAAAGMFLAGMKYCIPYAYPIWHHTKPDENPDYRYCGMFMHPGLFLRPLREDGRTYQPWGYPYDARPVRPHWTVLKNLGDTFGNGFTCSQLIGWTLVNAGINKYGNDTLYSKWADDLRSYPGSREVPLKEGHANLRAGDFLGFTGHISLVIAVDGDHVLFLSADGGGDAAWPGHGVRWHVFDRARVDYDHYQYKFLVDMSGVYGD